MLISHVPDSEGGAGVGAGREVAEAQDHSHEYQTASELFELMAKNQNFNSSDVESLTTRDLVLLYKNIDLGTKLMSDANEFKLPRSNQYVETVVYNEDPESDGSDLSEVYSNEDLHNVVLINKERIDLINQPSLENTLCHKLGDLEIQSSELNTEFDKHFLFKDPYIKEQLKSLNLITQSNEFEGTVLPASLLDYICCKRLEDNYNFYMDNIIRYVKHTIEQLKRISNGDYLTDKAKQKWREVESNQDIDDSNDTRILATSTSIPLHVEHKAGGFLSTWDDLVHSEVDLRSLSKILEKKIIVEVPKLICGSYKLLSKCCAENVIISCQKEKLPVEKANAGSRVNVVFQLQRSDSGQVMSNISSIMILQTTSTAQSDSLIPDSLPLQYQVATKTSLPEKSIKIIELENDQNVANITPLSPNGECIFAKDYTSDDLGTEESFVDSLDYPCSEFGNMSQVEHSCQDSTESSCALRDIIDKKVIQNEASFSIVSPDELRISMQRLNMQSSLPEESGDDLSPSATKRKSPTRVRIKSPYENKSHVIEEKKRKKLLEIRERREKKKMALAENCKITKHKFAKSAIMPQPSSSVTKLSITNKSFYNSIYGQSINMDKQGKGKNRKGVKKDVLEIETGDAEGDSEPMTPDLDSKKYTNRSYYLDDAVTEMMYMEMKSDKKDEGFSASTSEVSNDFRANLSLLSQLIGPSVTDFGNAKEPEVKIESKPERLMDIVRFEDKTGNNSKDLTTSQSTNNMVPSATPVINNQDIIDPKKSSSSVECRRSIDKIYDLMETLGKQKGKKASPALSPETKRSKIRLLGGLEKFNIAGGRGSSTIQGSDSGTSLKHHLISSNPSCFSFENNINGVKVPITQDTQTDTPLAVVPKVIISSKSQIPKIDTEKNKKEHKRMIINNLHKVQDNPLQAISQLLQEFENVQKTRQKSAAEQKPKKPEVIVSSEVKNTSRQNITKRRSRLDQHIKESAVQKDKSPKNCTVQKKPKTPADVAKINYQQPIIDDKHIDKITKKKIVDIIDEVKEARGEAVRGPSKINSRLNSLAQPKRTYVQAHSEEYQYKYGKNLMADRLQRLAAAQPPAAVEKTVPPIIKSRAKRPLPEPISAVSLKLSPPTVPPIDRGAKLRHSTSSGPMEKSALSPGWGPSCKQNVPDTPETLKKMVAVETYVNSHFGSPAGPAAMGGSLQSMQLSRCPLLPNDLELASLTSSPSPTEEATILGSKLHHIIDSMINTTPHGLGVLKECPESNSKIMKDSMDDNSLTDNLSRCDEHISTDSEYNVDIFEDKNVHTAVEYVENVTRRDIYEDVDEGSGSYHDVNTIDSTTQLETLENALYSHMSVGAFHKRLRIKKLTLTPKESMQQVVVLQSGDVGSLVIQSSVSPPALKINTTDADTLQHFKALPVLSRSQLDWGFAKFPMQVATVGYAFPQYQSAPFRPNTIKLLDAVSISTENIDSANYHLKNDKDSQCFKGEHRSRLQVAQTVDPKPVSEITDIVIPEVTDIIVPKDTDNSDAVHQQPEETKTEIHKIDEVKHVENEYIAHALIKELIEKPSEDEISPIITVDSKNMDVTHNSEAIDYTTSLDVLVGLLNEIKKITTCQTHMTATNENNTTNPDCKELETILNNAAAVEDSARSSPQDIVSITSLDKLRQLESNPSIYSFYLSDDEDQERCFSTINLHTEIPRSIALPCAKPVYVDKEVGVDLLGRELVNTSTDVPSKFLPIGVNHGTNVTSSLIGVLSEPSTQSLFSFTEYHTVYSKSSALNAHKNIIELQIATENFKEPKHLDNMEVERGTVGKQLVTKKIEIITKGSMVQNKLKVIRSDRCLLTTDFDPILKMKRDILVTVYSLLVFTVFAALSFPEVWYHI